MRSFTIPIANNNGFTTVFALLVLSIITVVSVAGISNSNTEIKMAANNQLDKMILYAADTADSYVELHPKLYGVDNITPGNLHFFPNNTAVSDPTTTYAQLTAEPSVPYTLNNLQNFTGSIEYTGFSGPPRGSGFEASAFRAHKYRIISNGYGPKNTIRQIENGVYRIGF